MLRARQYHISSTNLCILPAVKHSPGALSELGATPGEKEVLAALAALVTLGPRSIPLGGVTSALETQQGS